MLMSFTAMLARESLATCCRHVARRCCCHRVTRRFGIDANAGYQGFGSFHVEHSVEDMVGMTDEDFDACVPDKHRELYFPDGPAAHTPPPPGSTSGVDSVRFGEKCRHSLFPVERHCTFLNHGAFGLPIAHGTLAADRWRHHVEQQPLRFMDLSLIHI